ncbi:hypothetical protein RUM44_011721 [Polyplax serrata]|uniref:Pleckstrin homology domain-containing family J member 1 n=1 Tax=Polyplax serrata TaxID=468196 RepID=A0ABR1ARH2_POLSC
MKFNNKELADLSFGAATIEGRLHYKKLHGGYSHSGFKEKWFKLRANILFYFNLSESGQICDKKPVGAFILENVIVQYEMNSEAPFSFSFCFNDELEKKHLFSGRTQENINRWVEALKQASYEYWRSQLLLLQEKLSLITGQDPLLMYPRNQGCRHVFETSYARNSTYLSRKKSTQENSKSQFYTVEEEKIDCVFRDKKISSNNDTTPAHMYHEVPPVRPARGIKPKEVDVAKLIDI